MFLRETVANLGVLHLRLRLLHGLGLEFEHVEGAKFGLQVLEGWKFGILGVFGCFGCVGVV